MRALPLLLAALLPACGQGGGEPLSDTVSIECALDGAAGFAPDCTMERHEAGGESELIVRHPDGGFRRFQLGVEGRGLITADGAEQAEVSNAGGYAEVRVGADRYRLPLAQ